MSRIHEALLRAEKERVIVQSPIPNGPVAGQEIREEGATDYLPVPTPQAVETTVGLDVLPPPGEDADGFRKAEWKPDHKRLLFFQPQEHIAAVEGFRVLRSKLSRQQAQMSLRTVLVTSACSGEGKTFVAGNLAMAFAQQLGKKALLVDADLRRPSLHECFGVPASPGLAEYLRGEASEPSVVQYGDHAGLFLVTAGVPPPNPAELLNGERMHGFISSMIAKFDWIIFDSPPATGLADSMILSEITDGVLLVVSEGTPVKMVQLLAKEFQQRPVLGTVFNRAAARETHYYREYGKTYRQYGKTEQGGKKD